MNDFSFVENAHPNFIDDMYQRYQQDPNAVEESWATFFKGFDYAINAGEEGKVTGLDTERALKEFRVYALIRAYRNRGHLSADTNPIRTRKNRKPNLELSDYKLSEEDLDTTFQVGLDVGMENASLRDIVAYLKKVYCGKIGFEYHHIQKREKRRWLRNYIERHDFSNSYGLTQEKKKRILKKLNGAVVFEEFLGVKYVGQKRFSLEGGESAIVALDAIINAGAANKVEEIVMGMAHRGRLNVLVNIMGKTYEYIFKEFDGTDRPDENMGSGDVKYHMGFSSFVNTTAGKKVHLKLMPNPSHLESVNPVVQGYSRVKADLLYNSEYDRILPILIHGDAAIAGQGVVYETAQMSRLDGYKTGGTIHIVINNQIGFTTDFHEGRSSEYSTAAASAVDAPVLHVNGDDPESVLFAAELAIAYRQEFNDDVYLDMVCYRRHGHNEGDDPSFTQPEMYELINKHKNPRELYSQVLIDRGDVDKELAENMEREFKDFLQERLNESRQEHLKYERQGPENEWRLLTKRTTAADYEVSPPTGIALEQIEKVIDHLMTIPDGFRQLKKVNRLLKNKRKLLNDNKLDWAMAELLAYSSVLLEGKDVRMTGQDVRRGTFSHRHAVFYDTETYKSYNRLSNIQEEQGKFRIFNSLLSEFAVMGFEYGYSLGTPHSLVLWEAQFGDFYNGAQTILDQYISAAESKWGRMSGLVLLLPHGYAGQGPEHSSARLERFLQSCAEYNMTVANVTTPANFFHILRRQLARPFRKPLVIMSPKSLLRHSRCVSDISEFETGNNFKEVIDDVSVSDAQATNIRRVLYCTGKIYYELLAKKETDNRDDIAIVRVEQLYPFPQKQLNALVKKYKNAEMYWVQEEPENMGAWQYIATRRSGISFELVSRPASASPATGYKYMHQEEQQAVIDGAFYVPELVG